MSTLIHYKINYRALLSRINNQRLTATKGFLGAPYRPDFASHHYTWLRGISSAQRFTNVLMRNGQSPFAYQPFKDKSNN